ncbi:MAG TPA: transporter substrate-binding domain-containing protein [Aggregatilineaceae bacterium]|nr:transporter substrate-binding domain-containing protein [Aggregatilineaceae bacterium]
MKRVFSLLAVVVALVVLTPLSPVRATNILAPLPDLKGQEVVVVTAQDYTPMTFVDTKSNKGVGFEYEAWQEICLRLNCKVTFKVAAWDGMIVAVSNKQYDAGMDGITITDERKKQVDFSVPYTTVEEKVLVRADETRFKDVKSLGADKSFKLGSQSGTSNYDTSVTIVGKADADSRIVLFDDFGVAVQALLAGKVDGIVTDTISGRGYIGTNAGKLKLLDDVLESDPLGFMFPKGSALVSPVNAALASMKNDGYIAYLEHKWFDLYDPNAQ